MKPIYIFFLFPLLLSNPSLAQSKIKIYSLDQIISFAKERSLSTQYAKNNKDLKKQTYLNFKAGLRPQIDLTGNLIDYNKRYAGVVQPDGTVLYQRIAENFSTVNISYSQDILMTGGNVNIISSIARYDTWAQNNQTQYSGVPISVRLLQPILAFNPIKLNRQIELYKYQEAEKDFNRENEEISLNVARLYFDVLTSQAERDLSTKNLQNQKYLYEIELKKIDIGTTSKEKILQLELQILNSTQDSSRAFVNLKNALLRINDYLQFSDTLEYKLALPEDLPEFNISELKALNYLKTNRAEYLAYQRRLLEASRDVKVELSSNRAINIVAGYGLNNTGGSISSIYKRPNTQNNLTLGLSLPIVDFGRYKSRVAIAKANYKLLEVQIEQEKIAIEESVKSIVNNIELIKNNIAVAKKAAGISQERYLLTSEQFKFGKTSVTELFIALEQKDAAIRSYLNALRTFWESYYQIKILTLQDFSNQD